MRGQDELTRRRRLARGNCPTHGVGLVQIGVVPVDGVPRPQVACPRSDCSFSTVPEPGTALWKALHDRVV